MTRARLGGKTRVMLRASSMLMVLSFAWIGCKPAASTTPPASTATADGSKSDAQASPSASSSASLGASTLVTLKALGRRHTEQLMAGDVAAVWENIDDGFAEFLGSEDAVRQVVDATLGGFAGERTIASESAAETRSARRYIAEVTTGSAAVWRLTWSFDVDDRVNGLQILPTSIDASLLPHGKRVTSTALGLPFAGEWYVFWGGHTLENNPHVISAAQRHAYDFAVQKNGKTHAGEGKRNEDYYCFGQPILAPAAGTVITAVDNVHDNEPGTMNARQLLGNHVVVDHGQGEYSFLAHLKAGTVAVKGGQKLRAGARVGLCGNSGHSSEPHLHYHLQDKPMLDGAVGYPAQFQEYRVVNGEVAEGEVATGGEVVKQGQPQRGQFVVQ